MLILKEQVESVIMLHDPYHKPYVNLKHLESTINCSFYSDFSAGKADFSLII